VFYFFQRERETVTCEMRPARSGDGYDLIIMRPGAEVVTEHHATMPDMHKRWRELQESFRSEGWWGPAATHDPKD
jgi:hypothetical protein